MKRSKRLTEKSKVKSQKKTPKKSPKSNTSTSSETSVAKSNTCQTANGKAKKRKDTRNKTKTIITAAKKSREAEASPENDKKTAAKSTNDSKNQKKEAKKDLVESKSTQLQKEKTKRQLKQKQHEKKSDGTSCTSNHTSSSEEEEEEETACFMCHCGLDCSDRALFFPKDRKSELEEDEDYYFSLDHPYLDGDKFYDRNNALVYCDTCNRLYHQKCHFVPLLVVPRGDFHCLICSIQQKQTTQDKQSPSTKKRKRKNANGTKAITSSQSSAVQEKILNRKITDQIFQNPPLLLKTEDVQSFQKEWERESATYKALLWERQLKQLKTFLKSQATNIRMANTTLSTMTSTKRNRQHFLESSKLGGRSSQEVAQTLCKLTGAKFKIREAFLSLESIRTSNEAIDYSRLFSFCQEYPQHAGHFFPFGSNLCRDVRRIVPRTGERKPSMIEEGKQANTKCKNNKGSSIIPKEIIVNNNNTGERSTRSKSPPKASSAVTKCSKASTCLKRGEKDSMPSITKSAHTDVKPKKDVDDDDNDSGISLDDLKCSVCMIGDCSDENDVILCDGKDCHRAFHMKCVCPIVKSEDIENEDEDWFCPICESIAIFMGEMHDLCIGDDDDDAASSGSWEDIHDIFPNSQWEYETAMKILKGKRNEDTQRLMAMFLGEDTTNKSQVQMPVGSDSEDENDYSLFDEDSFKERRRKEKDDDDSHSDDSTCSVEFMVGKDELGALSEDDNESSEETSDDESETKIRKSRRLVRRKEVKEESNNADFGADFCESNIINGKRKRQRVNYRKLNDMMFGDLSDNQQVMIDGGDDFDASKIKVTKTESDNDSDDDDQDDNSGSKDNEQDDDSDSKDEEQGDDGGSKDDEQVDESGSS